MYIPIRDMITGKLPEGQNPSLLQKIAAGIATGTIGISVANPTDLVKVKMQGQGLSMLQGNPRVYNSSFDCYKKIVAEGGIANLWTGIAPNIMRNSIINAAELASYDQYKEMMVDGGYMREGILCHIVCATMAGCTACIVGSPVDVLKTRVMNAPKGMYSNPLDCAAKTLRNEGPAAFYKGFGPNCLRLSSWNVAMFLTLEQMRKIFMSKE
jgi:solute carrier family 25 uncoupling protein 8/9